MECRTKVGNGQLWKALEPILSSYVTTDEKISAIQRVLESESKDVWRQELGNWTVRMVPVDLLVPEVHRQWRPLVRDAMVFVVSRLSASRLAPKIVEQTELAPDTPPEVRLLRFIAKVPGLQKIGQVLARNRSLDPRLRRALVKLENGISDMTSDEVRAIINRELSSQIKKYEIELDPAILFEASVSAVTAFTWRNPETRRREKGVFKVLKPYIPSCYAEDMKILRQLAGHIARKHRTAGPRLAGFAETLTEIRLLLEREVDFPREQATLLNSLGAYRSIRGVRVPRLIPLLSTTTITALTRETGKKVTEAIVHPAKLRAQVAKRLAETLFAIPALASEKDSIFHADPHAGNILYDRRRNELVILDWALTERLTLKQRKDVLMLVLMMMLRDAGGLASAIERLCGHGAANDPVQARIIREHVARILNELPLTHVPGAMDAMRLLEEIALEGIRFPGALLMLRKASFTLNGVLEDIAGTEVRMDTVIAQYALAHWTDSVSGLFSLFSVRDWMALDWSALTFTSRMCAQALLHPRQWLPGLSARPSVA